MSEIVADVMIDGVVDHNSHLLLRAAAERDDVRVIGVTPGPNEVKPEHDERTHRHLVRYDSTYGRLAEDNDTVTGYMFSADPQELRAAGNNPAIVVLGASKAQTQDRYADAKGRLPQNIIITDPETWDGGKVAAWINPRTVQHMQIDSRAVFIPKAVVHAVEPPLKLLAGLGIEHLTVTEVGPFEADQTLQDSTREGVTELARTRATGINLIERPAHPGQSLQELLNYGRYSIIENHLTAPTALGGIALVSATLYKPTLANTVKTIFKRGSDIEAWEDQVVATRNVQGSTAPAVIPLDTVRLNKDRHLLGFSVYFDPGMSRAHRILDAAVRLKRSGAK